MVLPCDHFEWQPPHITDTKSCFPVPIVNEREPESSAGMNVAPQTPQSCSSAAGTCLSERVTSAI